MNDYPQLVTYSEPEIRELLTSITEERLIDIVNWNNLPNRFILGRKVGKIPTSASDVSVSDRIGDINYDDSYLYLVVDNSGATWARIALDTSW